MKLVVGDIHGCFDELMELIARANISDQDQVIAVGDILDRGPKSEEVLNYFLTHPNACSILGNHERKHIRSYEGRGPAALSQKITRQDMGEKRYKEAYEYMKTLPLYLDMEEALVIHGFWEPGLSLYQQKEKVLNGIRSEENELLKKYPNPWYELYDGNKPLIVGHHNYLKGPPLILKNGVWGIDTGACYGGALTGLLLPDFKIITIPSQRDYYTELKNHNPHLRYELTPDEKLNWEALKAFAEHKNLPQSVKARQLRLLKIHQESQAALDRVINKVIADYENALPQAGQSGLFAKKIGETPLAGFLHLKRKNQFSAQSVKKAFKRPYDLLSFCREHHI